MSFEDVDIQAVEKKIDGDGLMLIVDEARRKGYPRCPHKKVVCRGCALSRGSGVDKEGKSTVNCLDYPGMSIEVPDACDRRLEGSCTISELVDMGRVPKERLPWYLRSNGRAA